MRSVCVSVHVKERTWTLCWSCGSVWDTEVTSEATSWLGVGVVWVSSWFCLHLQIVGVWLRFHRLDRRPTVFDLFRFKYRICVLRKE